MHVAALHIQTHTHTNNIKDEQVILHLNLVANASIKMMRDK